MKKLTKTQICLIALAILNLCCLILFLICLIPLLENNFNSLKDLGATKYLMINSISSVIVLFSFILFMFLIINFVLFYVNQRIKARLNFSPNIKFSQNLIFVYILCIIVNIFSIVFQSFQIYLLKIDELTIWFGIMYVIITFITALFYTIFFSILLYKELKLKKLSNSSSKN